MGNHPVSRLNHIARNLPMHGINIVHQPGWRDDAAKKYYGGHHDENQIVAWTRRGNIPDVATFDVVLLFHDFFHRRNEQTFHHTLSMCSTPSWSLPTKSSLPASAQSRATHTRLRTHFKQRFCKQL